LPIPRVFAPRAAACSCNINKRYAKDKYFMRIYAVVSSARARARANSRNVSDK